MHKYLLRRVLITIPTLVGISLVLFTVLAMAPGDPFEELALNPNIPAEVRLNLRHQFGLDDPIPVRYIRWFTSMLRGDWGYSFVSRVDVERLILQRLPTTLFVLGTAYGLALLIALPVGVISAVRPYSLFDQIATTLRVCRLLPADVLYRPVVYPALQPVSGLAAVYLQHHHRGQRHTLGRRTFQTSGHAHRRAWPL